MNKDPFEIYIEDAGDNSVGLRSEIVFKAELSDNLINQLKEDNTLKEFRNRLQELVNQYYQPDTYFVTYDTDIVEAEKEYYEREE